MKAIAKLILVVSILLVSGPLTAQTFKCVDAAGNITYTGRKCSDLGLKDAGEVKDRLNVEPAYIPPVRRSAPPKPSAPAPAPQSAGVPDAAAESVQPERRCFVVKTPTGNVTRCNDKPD